MLHPNTFDFLKKLKKNNSKFWFDKHKEEYLEIKKGVEKFTEQLIASISKFDKSIANVNYKNCLFRIYRDVRFSKNKTPYKTHIGIFITDKGKNSNGPGYYIHLEPANCFVAGGVYMPESEQLRKIRQEIDYNEKEFLKIISNVKFKKLFNSLNEDDKLIKLPKGYTQDNPMIEYLKLKSYIAQSAISEKIALNPKSPLLISNILKALYPFNLFLKRAGD